MDDSISKRAAIDALTTYIYNVYKVVVGKTLPAEDCRDAAESVLDELPTVQPEIIRCRNCKHWDKTWTNDWLPDYHYCPMIDEVRKGDFYCADAERRTDE